MSVVWAPGTIRFYVQAIINRQVGLLDEKRNSFSLVCIMAFHFIACETGFQATKTWDLGVHSNFQLAGGVDNECNICSPLLPNPFQSMLIMSFGTFVLEGILIVC